MSLRVTFLDQPSLFITIICWFYALVEACFCGTYNAAVLHYYHKKQACLGWAECLLILIAACMNEMLLELTYWIMLLIHSKKRALFLSLLNRATTTSA